MTRETGRGQICGQFHLQGCVRIRVARVASADLIVGLPGMAHAAGRNYLVFAHHRRVSFVTAHAGDCGFVLAAVRIDGSLHPGMALHTVSVREFSLRFRCLFLRKTFFLVGVVEQKNREKKAEENKEEQKQFSIDALVSLKPANFHYPDPLLNL